MPPGKDHEEDLKQFEAELASLIPRRDRVEPGWGGFLAEKAARRNWPEDAPCERTSGHVFVCLYCGRGADRSSDIRRFAWPASLAAMATLAAALFVMLLLAQRGPQFADRSVVSPAIDPTAPTFATSTPTAAPDRIAGEHRSGGNPGALTSADAELLEGFYARGHGWAGNAAASAGPWQMSQQRLSSFELIERMVCDPRAADDPLGRLILEPSFSTETTL